MIKAVIFDLDGTLVNTLPSIAYFANRALEENGFSKLPEDRYRYLVGEGASLLVKRMLREVGGDPEADFQRVYEAYRREYDANSTYGARYYDGMLNLLGILKHRRLRLAVLSNKPQTQVANVIGGFFPEGLFEVVFGAQEGLPRKPDPEGVYRIAKILAVQPRECLYLGDTATDMRTGSAAGCRTIGAGWGFRDEKELMDSGALAVAKTPEQVVQYL